jgi:hypothetical protein
VLEAQVKQVEANAANYNSKASQQGTSRTKSSPAGNVRNVKPAWMTEPPKADEPQKKTVNAKEYHWCPNHLAWVRHLPSECEGKGVKPSKSKPAPPKPILTMRGLSKSNCPMHSQHLSIVPILKHFTRIIENRITNLDTRTARERKQTRINLTNCSWAHYRPCKKVNLCRLACMLHVVICATNLATAPQTHRVIFDTGSIPI